MATQYTIQLNQAVIQQDLPKLPEELQADFERYQQVLAIDPHRTRGLPKFNRIAKFPNLGKSRAEVFPGLRSLPLNSYLVLYTIADESVSLQASQSSDR